VGTHRHLDLDPIAQRAWAVHQGFGASGKINESGELRAGAIHLPVADIFR